MGAVDRYRDHLHTHAKHTEVKSVLRHVGYLAGGACHPRTGEIDWGVYIERL